MYDSTMGRWISEDPLGIQIADPPYGVEVDPSPIAENHYTWASRDRAAEAQYAEMPHYMDGRTGKWVSLDQTATNGESNLYRYCNNAPTDGTDPSGMDCQVRVLGLFRSNTNVHITIPIRYEGKGATKDVVARFNKAIETAWSGKFGKYTVKTIVTTPTDPKAIIDEATNVFVNVIQVPEGDGGKLRAFVIADRAGAWPANAPDSVVAHEAGHLMHLPDQYDPKTFKANKGYENDIMNDEKKKVQESNIAEILKKNFVRR